jgi:hypothetical protein
MRSDQATDLTAPPQPPAAPPRDEPLGGGSADMQPPGPVDGQGQPESLGAASVARITADVMDSVSQQLSLTGFELSRFGARLSDARDRLTLSQITDQLDVAIAEVRRLALIAKRAAES